MNIGIKRKEDKGTERIKEKKKDDGDEAMNKIILH
jgi:hypothetical protein